MKKPDCNLYEGGEIPPCSAFLDNSNPIIKDCKLIFRNLNRLFYFISASTINPSTQFNASTVAANIQISLSTFIIGLFINQVQVGIITYDQDCMIHSNKEINAFIHETLQNPPIIDENFFPSLSLVYSNGNAILDPFTFTLNISKLNFYILLIISRLEMNLGLFFIDNSFATEDCINFFLASLNIQCPFEENKKGEKIHEPLDEEITKLSRSLSKEQLNKLYELLRKL